MHASETEPFEQHSQGTQPLPAVRFQKPDTHCPQSLPVVLGRQKQVPVRMSQMASLTPAGLQLHAVGEGDAFIVDKQFVRMSVKPMAVLTLT